MENIFFDQHVGYLFLIVIALLLFAQAYVLLRIRNILQIISMNFDSILYFCRKILSNQSARKSYKSEHHVPKTCQFCRHRLAYINTSKTKTDEDDFYHVCALRNLPIELDNTCNKFELDDEIAA